MLGGLEKLVMIFGCGFKENDFTLRDSAREHTINIQMLYITASCLPFKMLGPAGISSQDKI